LNIDYAALSQSLADAGYGSEPAPATSEPTGVVNGLTFGHVSQPAPAPVEAVTEPAQTFSDLTMQLQSMGYFKDGGIVSVAPDMDFSRTSHEGLESFLPRDPRSVSFERKAATLRKNLRFLDNQRVAPGPRPTMQQGIMPMAQG
jgi:hypothetical protein